MLDRLMGEDDSLTTGQARQRGLTVSQPKSRNSGRATIC